MESISIQLENLNCGNAPLFSHVGVQLCLKLFDAEVSFPQMSFGISEVHVHVSCERNIEHMRLSFVKMVDGYRFRSVSCVILTHWLQVM